MSPRLRSNDPLRFGSPEVPGDPDHTKAPHLKDEMQGFHLEGANGGLNRPDYIVENVEEVELRFAGRPEIMLLECAYCGDRMRTRSTESAHKWWRAHDCGHLQEQEQAAIVYDLSQAGLGVDPPDETRIAA